MLMWRSGCSSSGHAPSIAASARADAHIVLAVGRLRPPYADDVQHYQQAARPPHRLELIELRDEEKVAGRIPERAYVCLLDRAASTFDSIGVQPLPRGAAPVGPRPLLRGRRAARARSRPLRPEAVVRPDDAAAPARAGGAAGAALPRAQDPRPRAIPLLTCQPTDGDPVARPARAAVADGSRRSLGGERQR